MDLMLEWRGNDNVILLQKTVIGRDEQDPSIFSVKWTKMKRM